MPIEIYSYNIYNRYSPNEERKTIMNNCKTIASWFYIDHNEKGRIGYHLRDDGIYGYYDT